MMSEDDPALIFGWDHEVVRLFVVASNGFVGVQPALPGWMTVLPGNLTADALMQDIIVYLRAVGGGMWPNVAIAPNSQPQFFNVGMRLSTIVTDPFMQAVMQAVNAAGGGPHSLARLGYVTDRSLLTIHPLNTAAPGGLLVPLFS
jgi:hypothetical protein